METARVHHVLPGLSTRAGVWVTPRRLLLVADAVALLAAAGVATVLLEWRDVHGWWRLVALLSIVLSCGLAIILVGLRGRYSVRSRVSRLSEVTSLVGQLILATAVVMFVEYVTQGFFTGVADPPRSAVLGGCGVFLVLAVVGRFGVSLYERRLFSRGLGVRRVLLVGDGEVASAFCRFLERRPWLGTVCAGKVRFSLAPLVGSMVTSADQAGDGERPGQALPCITPTLEGLSVLHDTLVKSGAEEVVVALDEKESGMMPQLTRLLMLGHVPFRVVPSLFDSTFAPMKLAGFAEIPVLEVRIDPLSRVQRLVKRGADVAVAGLILILGFVPALLIALAVRIDSHGPVFFKQERVGKNGRHFIMYKFRTMRAKAEEELESLRHLDETQSGGRLFKIREDPRITRVGRFLRRLSLDEFPQFLNVLKGEMSVVGPRPPLPEEVANYEPHHLHRLRGTPGITGLWQVSGRSDLSFEDMVRLDRYYLENWSLGLDLYIMVKTVWVMLSGRGAY